MTKIQTIFAVAAASLLFLGGLVASPALSTIHDSTSAVDVDEHGVALQGYDPVAYFVDGSAKKGNRQFSVEHDGAMYFFENAENKRRFEEDPASYLPQYGGFCAMGTANGYKFEGDPTIWKIVSGKLYLNFNPDVDKRWREDIPGNLAKANVNWPTIKNQTPDELQQR